MKISRLKISYDFMDAIEDIKEISKDKKLGITKDVLPHLAVESEYLNESTITKNMKEKSFKYRCIEYVGNDAT